MRNWRIIGSRVANAFSGIISAFVLCIACSDNVDDGIWEFAEVDRLDAPLTAGAYRAEFRIHRDECSPSLAELNALSTGWPPPEMGIAIFDYSNSPDIDVAPGMDTHLYLLRHFGTTMAGAELNPDLSPIDNLLFDSRFPEEQLVDTSCPANPYWGNFRSRAIATVLDSETIEIKVETEWAGYDDCEEGGELQFFNDWIPQVECTESYSFILELMDPCGPPTQCQSLTAHQGVRAHSITPYPPGVTNVQCICDPPLNE